MSSDKNFMKFHSKVLNSFNCIFMVIIHNSLFTAWYENFNLIQCQTTKQILRHIENFDIRFNDKTMCRYWPITNVVILFLSTQLVDKQNKGNNALVLKRQCGSDIFRSNMLQPGVDLRIRSVIDEVDMTDKSNARPEKVYIVRTSPLSRWAFL